MQSMDTKCAFACNWVQKLSVTLFVILSLATICNVIWGSNANNEEVDENKTMIFNANTFTKANVFTNTTMVPLRLKRQYRHKRSTKVQGSSNEELYMNNYGGIMINNDLGDSYKQNLAIIEESQKKAPSEYDEIVTFCKDSLAGNKTNSSSDHNESAHELDDHSQKCARERNGSAPVLWILFYIIIVLFLFIGLAGICDDFFVPSLEAISDKLNLSKDVAGATFMAAGSSAPEIFTSITAVGVGSDVGVGTIVGSAVFNLLIIVALTAALAGKVLDLDWRPFIRDTIFYGASVVALLVFSWDAKFYYWESLFLLVLYSLYIVCMKFNSVLMIHMGKIKCGEHFETGSSDSEAENSDIGTSGVKRDSVKRNNCEEATTSRISKIKKVEFKQDKITNTKSANAIEENSEVGPSLTRATSLPVLQRHKSTCSFETPPPRLQSIKLCFDDKNIEFNIPNATVPTPIYFINEDNISINNTNNNNPSRFVKIKPPSCGGRKFVGIEVPEAWMKMKTYDDDDISDGLYEVIHTANANTNNNQDAGISRSSMVVEHEEETMQVFPCLPRIQHAKPTRPASSECLPGTKFVFAYVMFLLALPWICAFTWTIPNCRKPDGKKWYMVSFTFSIIWIAIISFYMVELVEKIGCLLGIDSYTMGLVVVAVGTSVPDAISSVLVARDGYGDMAVSNAMGSNVFDINLGLGLPFFIGNIITMKPVSLFSPIQQCIFDAVPLSIKIVPHTKFAFILILILIIAVAFLILVRFKLNRILGTLFVAMYVIFLIYAFVQEKVCHGLYC